MTKRIVLDAGHGLGTAGKRVMKKFDSKETREWTLNSRVANYVEEFLKEYEGYQILRVDDRTGKVDIPLVTRAKKSNDWKADIFVSIHHNAGINGGSGGGITVYRYPNSSKMTKVMMERLYNELIKQTGLKGNRAKPLNDTNFQVLRQTNAPAILIENGFMDSSKDVPIILSDGHARKSARAIVNWLVSELKLKKKPTPKPNPKPTPSGKGYFRVVVGSYKDRENAENQQKKLKDKGFDSFLVYYEE